MNRKERRKQAKLDRSKKSNSNSNNDNMANVALRTHYGITSAEAQQIVDVDKMLNNVNADQETHNKVDVRFKICNAPGICAFSVFEPETSLSASKELLEMCMRQYKDAKSNGQVKGREPFTGKHAELINRLGYVMQVTLNSQHYWAKASDDKERGMYETIMSAALMFIRHSIKEYLGVEAGHIEMVCPGIDPSCVHSGQDMDNVMLAITKGFTSWCIKDTEGNVMDIDCDFADVPWDMQINGMKQNGLLKEAHRRPEMAS